MLNPELCESCRTQEKPRSDAAYFLCDDCFQHMKEKTLLPLEFYHLTVLHGLDYRYDF